MLAWEDMQRHPAPPQLFVSYSPTWRTALSFLAPSRILSYSSCCPHPGALVPNLTSAQSLEKSA